MSTPREQFCQAFGSRLKGLREARGLTLELAAEHTGLEAERWRQWESGIGCPYMDEQIPMGELFGLDLDELANGPFQAA